MSPSVTLTAALVIFTAFVRVATQPLFGIPEYFDFDGMDIFEDPFRVITDPDLALDLIDRLCSQPFDERRGFGIVSGALNIDTAEFKTWDQYRASYEGVNGNGLFNFANGPWHTFWGRCSLKLWSTRFERGTASRGTWSSNLSNVQVPPLPPLIRISKIDVIIPGFGASTSMPSWMARCQNRQNMADAFTTLLLAEGQGNIVRFWPALDKVEEEFVHKDVGVPVESQKRGRIVTSTCLRVVQAVQIFEVGGWFWHYSDNQSGVGTTWLSLGPTHGDWKIVYTKSAHVEGFGPNAQLPPPGSRFRQWDNRVVYSTDESDIE
jgi:hypothetical protein